MSEPVERSGQLVDPTAPPPAAHRAPLHVRALGTVPYAEALSLQESLVAANACGDADDELLLLEHPPVYTLGRGADASDLRGAPERLGVPVYRVGRGGGATFHGPGQLVAYPVVRLRAAGRDVHRYVRALEATLIDTCARFGVMASAPPEQTGVWVGEHKIGAIGIGVRRGVAYHGIALNVSTDLSYFCHIVPCRSSGMVVTSLAQLLGSAPPVDEVGVVFAARFAARMGFSALELEPSRSPEPPRRLNGDAARPGAARGWVR
jgi:lipoate-protein ligase B